MADEETLEDLQHDLTNEPFSPCVAIEVLMLIN